MQSILISREKLLPIVKANQEKHDIIFADAVSGYWVKAENVLKDKLTKIEAKQEIDNYLGLAYPENHADDYARAISMIELSHRDVLELSVQEFDSYVRNQWSWRNSFLSVNSTYHFSGAAITTGCAF